MDYKLVESEIQSKLYKDEKSGHLWIQYKTVEKYDAGDLVRALLKYTSEVEVQWEDDGDAGMQNGDCCAGQKFVYPGIKYFYRIDARYNGMDMMFNTYTIVQNIPYCSVYALVHFENIEEVSAERLEELKNVTIPKLLGWISDQEADD